MRLLCAVLLSVLTMQAGTVLTFEPTTYAGSASLHGQDGWDALGTRTNTVVAYGGSLVAANTWTVSYDVLLVNPEGKEASRSPG